MHQLSAEELKQLIHLTNPTKVVTLTEALGRKLQEMLSESEAIDRASEEATVESFPSRITAEEAIQYSDRGEKLMLSAAKMRIDERVHADMSCLVIGQTSVLSRLMQVERERFCNDLISNVMFAAMKAAYVLGTEAEGKG